MQFLSDLLRNGKGFLVIGLMVALLTACGGSDNGGGGSNPPPTVTPDDEDTDGDGVIDDDDNCVDDANEDQADADGDGIGDACDDDSGTADGDGDGVNDDEDNCPAIANEDQADADGDGVGDACEEDAPDFATFQPASFVIGQPDFAAGEQNQGGGEQPSASSLDAPAGGVAYSAEDDVFFVTDSGNSRVLGFLGVPDVNNTPADFVLGQANFTSNNQEVSASGMISPEAVSVSDGRLMVSDTDLNRVAVYDGVPTAGGVNPTLVIGQAALDQYSAACDQSTLTHIHDHLLTPDGKFLVADAGNNRIMVWDTMPTTDGAPASMVLGQINFENCTTGESFNFDHPSALWSDGTMLIVADSEKHRVLIWNTFPESSLQEPDVILGQSNMTNIAPNDDDQDGTTDEGNVPSARTFDNPRDIEVVDGKLYIADIYNNRVLIWDAIPTESFAPADRVLGQPDFTSNAVNAGEAAPNDRGFNNPIGVSMVGEQLFVTDWNNSRIVVFDKQEPAAE